MYIYIYTIYISYLFFWFSSHVETGLTQNSFSLWVYSLRPWSGGDIFLGHGVMKPGWLENHLCIYIYTHIQHTTYNIYIETIIIYIYKLNLAGCHIQHIYKSKTLYIYIYIYAHVHTYKWWIFQQGHVWLAEATHSDSIWKLPAERGNFKINGNFRYRFIGGTYHI